MIGEGGNFGRAVNYKVSAGTFESETAVKTIGDGDNGKADFLTGFDVTNFVTDVNSVAAMKRARRGFGWWCSSGFVFF